MKHKLSSSRTLGPMSARFIYELVERGTEIFTLNDACTLYGRGRQETSDFLRELVNRGILVRIKSGVFLIPKTGQENTQLSNWPIIARTLAGTNNYYISHYSAMRLHGMTTHPLSEIAITLTKKQPVKKVLQNITYRFIYSKPQNFWGFCDHWVTKQEKVQISDLERTILDGLARPELCGGIKEVVRGIWSSQKKINWNKLVEYTDRYHTKAAVKRLGFILEILNLEANCLPSLKNSIKFSMDYILFDPSGSKLGKYLNRWHVRVNMNIDELKASIWG